VQRKGVESDTDTDEGEPGAKKIPHAIPLQTAKEIFHYFG